MLKRRLLKTTVVLVAALGVLTLSVFALLMGRGGIGNDARADIETKNDVAVSGYPVASPVTLLVAGRDGEAGLYDVMMLVRVDASEDDITVLQIPRDTYAEYTEGHYKKINGAPSVLGGIKGLCSFLSESFCISIDGYASLDMSVLPSVVDTLGGVEIELEEPFSYGDGINIPSGKQTLNGEAALHFLRYRAGYVRGDLGRMDAQKIFLASLARKANSLGAVELARIAAAILPKLDTDISLSRALTLGRIVTSVPEENITFITLPGEEVIATVSGASYYSISAPATREILHCRFGADGETFDQNALFKNERYESFCNCYEKYVPYKLYTVRSLCENGIIIDKRQ